MEATTKKDGAIIPSKEQVYLDGPKSRGYELGFAWRVFWQFIKGFNAQGATMASLKSRTPRPAGS